MELDELKTKWRELDGRLANADAKVEQMAAEIAAGKFTSAKQRLMRMQRLGLFLVAVLPFLFVNIFRAGEPDPGTAVYVLLALFVMAMFARQLLLMILLRRIDPARQSVREACAAVLRFRKCFLGGVVVGVALAVPLIVVFGIYVSRLTQPYVLYGFLCGLIVGLPLGIRVFFRMYEEVNTLRAVLQDVEE